MSTPVNTVRKKRQFVEDYKDLPRQVQKQVDRKVKLLAQTNTALPSFKAHRVKNSSLWIGYVNRGPNGYRILYQYLSSGTLILERVLGHDDMERMLRNLTSGR